MGSTHVEPAREFVPETEEAASVADRITYLAASQIHRRGKKYAMAEDRARDIRYPGSEPSTTETKDIDWIQAHGTDRVPNVTTDFEDLPWDVKAAYIAEARAALDQVAEASRSGDQGSVRNTDFHDPMHDWHRGRVAEAGAATAEARDRRRNQWERDDAAREAEARMADILNLADERDFSLKTGDVMVGDELKRHRLACALRDLHAAEDAERTANSRVNREDAQHGANYDLVKLYAAEEDLDAAASNATDARARVCDAAQDVPRDQWRGLLPDAGPVGRTLETLEAVDPSTSDRAAAYRKMAETTAQQWGNGTYAEYERRSLATEPDVLRGNKTHLYRRNPDSGVWQAHPRSTAGSWTDVAELPPSAHRVRSDIAAAALGGQCVACGRPLSVASATGYGPECVKKFG